MNKQNGASFITQVRPAKFFTLTFILSWLIWVPLVTSHFEIGSFYVAEETSKIVRLLGVLMPSASALILTARAGGCNGLRALLSRLTLWRVNWRWWLVAVFGQPILLGLAAITFNLISEESKVTPGLLISASEFIINVVILLIATLGEEIGWRGVALPSLQQHNSALGSSVTLGFLWATWHLPFWLLLESFDQFGFRYLLLNFLFVLPLTIFITWFFNHGKSSLLLPVAFHLTFNIVNTVLLPLTINIGAFGIFIAFEWLLVVLLLPHLKLNQTRNSM